MRSGGSYLKKDKDSDPVLQERTEDHPKGNMARPVPEEIIEPTEPEVRLQAVISAIEGIDPTNPDLWTGGGKPKLEVLEQALGWPATTSERGEALSIIETERTNHEI